MNENLICGKPWKCEDGLRVELITFKNCKNEREFHQVECDCVSRLKKDYADHDETKRNRIDPSRWRNRLIEIKHESKEIETCPLFESDNCRCHLRVGMD